MKRRLATACGFGIDRFRTDRFGIGDWGSSIRSGRRNPLLGEAREAGETSNTEYMELCFSFQ
jgi:hypothetical protein